MPVRTAADESGHFQILSITNVYSIEVWRKAMDELLASTVFIATGRVLVDRRVSTPPTTVFVDHIVAFFGDHAKQLSAAHIAIVTSEDTSFGMGRMTEQRAHRRNPTLSIQIFRTYDEAVAWLTDPSDSEAR